MFSISGFLPFLPPSKNSFQEKVQHFLHQSLRLPVFSDSFRCRTGCRKHKKGVGKGEGGKPDKVMRWQAENVRGRSEEGSRRLLHQWLISDILHQAQEVWLVFPEMRNRHRSSLMNRFFFAFPTAATQRFAAFCRRISDPRRRKNKNLAYFWENQNRRNRQKSRGNVCILGI